MVGEYFGGKACLSSRVSKLHAKRPKVREKDFPVPTMLVRLETDVDALPWVGIFAEDAGILACHISWTNATRRVIQVLDFHDEA